MKVQIFLVGINIFPVLIKCCELKHLPAYIRTYMCLSNVHVKKKYLNYPIPAIDSNSLARADHRAPGQLPGVHRGQGEVHAPRLQTRWSLSEEPQFPALEW